MKCFRFCQLFGWKEGQINPYGLLIDIDVKNIVVVYTKPGLRTDHFQTQTQEENSNGEMLEKRFSKTFLTFENVYGNISSTSKRLFKKTVFEKSCLFFRNNCYSVAFAVFYQSRNQKLERVLNHNDFLLIIDLKF